MFAWFLRYLERKGRKSLIMDRENLRPYLDRYYALWPDSVDRERKDIPFNILIHRFHTSDDPVIHSHPWNFSFSIILKGGYWEHLPDKTIWRRRFSWRLMRHGKSDLHWVEIPKGQEGKVWTLFVRGRTISSWGFKPDINGPLIPWKKYIEDHRKV